MCAGALVNARIGRVVFGAKDAKAGACGSVLQLDAYPLNHRLRAQGGVLEQECAAVLSAFFEERRAKRSREKWEIPYE
jgi:tRNA(adenine34) deaminase